MNSSAPTIVLIGSRVAPVAGTGTVWRAIDGEPAYLRARLLGPAESAPDPAELAPGATLWVGTQIDTLRPAGDPALAGALLAVGQEPAPGHEDEFNAWLDDEHLPGLAGVPGTLSAHRYRSESCEPMYYAVYYLRDLDVNASAEWKTASKTDRSAAMKPHSRKRVRGLYVPA